MPFQYPPKRATMPEEKLPPHNIDAEEAVLGSLLLDSEAMAEVANLLKTDDFFREKNSWVYGACLALYKQGIAINQISVAHELQKSEKLEGIGGPAYLLHILSAVPTSLHIKTYAGIVKEMSLGRQVINIAGKIAAMGFEADKDAISKGIEALSTLNVSASNLVSSKEWANIQQAEMLRRYSGGEPGLTWGWLDVDRITGGLIPGEFTIIGSRPGVGKTTILQQVSTSLAHAGKSVLFVSAEMTLIALGDRHLAAETGIPIRTLRKGKYSEDDWKRIQEAIGNMAELPIWPYAGNNITTLDILSKAKEILGRVGKLDLVVVDYLQILRDQYGQSENVRIGHISANLKNLAKELNIPVVVASQLNRNLELRSEKRPVLADLRDSGSLEQDADIVLFLHREELVTKPPQDKGILEIIQAKHRQFGGSQSVKLLWRDNIKGYANLQKVE